MVDMYDVVGLVAVVRRVVVISKIVSAMLVDVVVLNAVELRFILMLVVTVILNLAVRIHLDLPS